MLSAVSRLALPDEAISEAREELRRRLRAPSSSVAENGRDRLFQRVENLPKQHEWGDITDAQYRTGRSDS